MKKEEKHAARNKKKCEW